MTPKPGLIRAYVRRAPTLTILLCISLVFSALITSHPTGAAASPAGPPAGWTTAFADNFTGAANTGLDSNWRYDLGTSYPGGAPAWGTGEAETATNAHGNVHQDGAGNLVITPIRDAGGQWTSGRVETARTDFAAPVGGELMMTASIRQPNPALATGYWPAFWALGAAARPVSATNWPSVGELDVMEDVNGLSQVSHTFHCGVWGQPPCNEPDGISSGLLACASCQTGYHTYSVIVDRTDPQAEQLRFLTDGVVQYTVDQNQVSDAIWAAAVDHGFFLILDVAVGGSYPNKVCGCDSMATAPSSGAGMSVDYVAVYQKAAGTSPAPSPTTTPSTSAAPTTPTAPATMPATSTAPVSTVTPPGSRVRAQSTIQAEGRNARSGTGTQLTTDSGGGSNIGWIGNGDWVRYDNIDFGATPLTQFDIRCSSGAPAGVSGLVEVRLDSPTGRETGSLAIASTGGWQSWRTVPANIAPTTGIHDVYLTFVSGSGHDFTNINWFTFAP